MTSLHLKFVSIFHCHFLHFSDPPLAHFENLNYEQTGSGNVGKLKSHKNKIPFLIPSSFSDQHGNIHANVIGANNFPKPPVPVRNIQIITNNGSKPINGNASSDTTSANIDPPKKESRLKHFFSPIRKKQIAPNPPETSQPDVFVSNILPSNMYVNPLHIQSSVPQTSSKPPENLNETSPTTSFQVNSVKSCLNLFNLF